MRSLLMVPGLGDNVASYRAAAPFWWARGFKPFVFNFRWGKRRENVPPAAFDPDSVRNEFAERLNALRRAILELPGQVCLFGASAGGTAILNAFLGWHGSWKVERLALVASPIYRYTPGYWENLLLKYSLDTLQSRFKHVEDQGLGRVRLFFGPHDERVEQSEATPRSTRCRWPYIDSRVLPGFSHNAIIGRALTVNNARIARWFTEGQ